QSNDNAEPRRPPRRSSAHRKDLGDSEEIRRGEITAPGARCQEEDTRKRQENGRQENKTGLPCGVAIFLSAIFLSSLAPRKQLQSVLGKTFHRCSFIVVNFEDCNEFGDCEQIVDSFGSIEQLQFAAGAFDRRIAANDFAKPAAIHIRHIGKINQQLGLIALDQFVYFTLQLDVAFAEQNLALNI